MALTAFGAIANRIVAQLETEDLCERCGEPIEDASVEAFELTGQCLCDGCTEEAFEQEAFRDAH